MGTNPDLADILGDTDFDFENSYFFFIHQPHRPAQRPKTGLGVIGDEPCRLNGATQALWETVESTTCAEPSTGCLEEAIPQTDQAA